MNRRSTSSRRVRGFTLVEVLLALVLLAALLTALNQFVFSITEVWTRRQEHFVFIQHTRAVARHVEELVQTAAVAARRSGTTLGAAVPAECPLPQGRATLLQFDLPAGDRVMGWTGQPLPEVQCALGWTGEDGLVLYWKSRLELDFASAPLRKAVLSPYVTALSYDYYDDIAGSWQTKADLQPGPNGTYLAPSRLRLRFRHGKEETEEIITLPDSAEEGVPAY
ncbi:MAG: prepilin-type N-terminal cleavage/methylation domain-containing protein [Opitutae bacterium]|nr:prepilin-type N-terminal cleavage/methylation domain-containing protein [Opitutae bacterium]